MTEIKKIPIDELKPGMRFDRPIYIDSNNMLVDANVIIKEEDIKKLQKWGISAIETSGTLVPDKSEGDAALPPGTELTGDVGIIFSDYNSLLKKRRRLIEVHRNACDELEKIHTAIKNMAKFKIKDLEAILKDIISLVEENRNIFIFLYGLDEGKNYLVVHSVNVTFYTILMGLSLKYPPEKVKELGIASLLIDAGMLKIPVYILHKQSTLTDQEYNTVKTHPIHGYKLLKQLGEVPENIAIVCLQHHEQYDGRGYPRGLKGHQIDEYARIAAIADSYEALISNRSYRKKQFFYFAMRNLLSSGVNKFDPVILKVFLSCMSVYPIGSMVQLNDNSVGLVVGSIPQKPLRPIIKMVFDKGGKRVAKTLIKNLLEDSSLFITKALDEEQAGVSFLDVL
jgi:HD-GYP domain-containing protein (c-di-GMP phosphodiesterase class II)